MTLEILSAEEKVYSGEVDSVIFPGSEGEFQILNNRFRIAFFECPQRKFEFQISNSRFHFANLNFQNAVLNFRFQIPDFALQF